MTRIPMKSSMYAVPMMVSMLICAATLAFGELQLGTAIGPGVGGQVHAFAFDPENQNVSYAGGDVCGAYRYDASTDEWSPWSTGLGTGDINQAYYVDDLLVLRDAPNVTGEGDIPDAWEGVYAATQGGLYFRPVDGPAWRHVATLPSEYTGGHACAVFHYGNGDHCDVQQQKIPFCSLAYDASEKTLYLGAGSARVDDRTVNFYPRTNAGSAAPLPSEYSLWALDLRQPAPPGAVIHPVYNPDALEGCGYARQIAVTSYVEAPNIPHTVVVASCEKKVVMYDHPRGTTEWAINTIWSATAGQKNAQSFTDYSALSWGVAAGSGGQIYISTRRDSTATGGPLLPTVWRAVVPDVTNWTPVPDDASALLWINANDSRNWLTYLRGASQNDQLIDLTELSVIPHEGGQDEIFVGIGRVSSGNISDCGYVRYGSYQSDGVARTGWAFVHRSTGQDVYVTDWRSGNIATSPLSGEAIGWHRFYPSLHALTPFYVHPRNPDLMVGIDYGIPLMTRHDQRGWFNLYCSDRGGGYWRDKGLNLLCARSAAMTTDGRLVIGAADYGVFCARDAVNEDFRMLHAPSTGFAVTSDFPDARDVEVLRIPGDAVHPNGYDQFYYVDEYVDENGHDENFPSAIYTWADVDGTSDWTRISEDIRSELGTNNAVPEYVLEMTVLTQDRIIAAVGKPVGADALHCYLLEGIRSSVSGQWDWTVRWDLDSAHPGAQTALVNDIITIPGTSICVFAAKRKDNASGGIFAVDYSEPATGMRWSAPKRWFGDNDTGTVRHRQSRNVTALAVDAAGSYLYAGSSRADSAWEPGRGAVMRCHLAGITAPSDSTYWEVISENQNLNWAHFPFENRKDYPTGGSETGLPVACWEWYTSIGDIAVDPRDSAACYVAVRSRSYTDDELGVWYFANGNWTHIWGGGEVGGGAETVDVSPNGSKLYVGSAGQEFFSVDIAPMGTPPDVQAEAEYPMLKTPGGTGTNVFAVRVTAVDGRSVQSVHADGFDLCNTTASPVEMKDDGTGADLVRGDGVYSSPWLSTHIGNVSWLDVKVTAVGSDANYVVSNVRTPVISTAPAVTVTALADHAILAGSTNNESTFAVKITSDGPVPTAYATICDSAGACVRELRDSGQNGDDAAGDHIYTSAPFVAAGVSPDSALVSVMPISNYGASAPKAVTVDVVDSSAKFADVTASTGDLVGALSELPYSAIYFTPKPGDTSMKEVMVVTFDSDTSGKAPQILQRNGTADDGAPVFSNKTGAWTAAGDLQPGSRGICYADYDNDGDMDFFICNPVSGGKLYRNSVEDGLGFRNVTTAVFGADSTYVAHAITAAWGDYNADGFADLYVAGTSYFNSVQALTGAMVSAVDGGDGGGNGGGSGGNSATDQEWVFRNRQGAGLVRTGFGGPIVSNVVLSACWADMDNDGDLDLITSKYILGAVRVCENVGYVPIEGDNILVRDGSGWNMPSTDPDCVYGANSVTVFDENHDSYPDLVVTFATHDGNPKVKIFRNRFGAGSKVFETYDLAHGVEWNGATVTDFDLDGQGDILLQPRVAGLAPALYLGRQVGQALPAYVDAGYTLGLRGGVTGGAIAVDFDDEHNIDLYLGRGGGAAARAVYRNVGTAASTQRWLDVQLTTRAHGQGSLLGTKVVVECDGRTWTRTVEGGTGRGGQSANRLLFGLGAGAPTSTAQVTAYFPSGEVEPSDPVSPNGSLVELDEHLPIAFTAGSNPTCRYELAPGQTDWIFKWKTSPYRGDPMLDKVEVKNDLPYAPDGYCGIGISEGQSKPLLWGSPRVEYRVYKVGSDWIHEVRWKALPCGASCQYKFRVTSGLGTQTVTSLWRPATTNSFCVPDPGPILNQQ